MNALRCKPGDLCVVVAGIPVENIGRIVKVMTVMDLFGWKAWHYEGNLTGPHGGRASVIADDCLCPLRDPGSDAKDETLTWLKDKVDA